VGLLGGRNLRQPPTVFLCRNQSKVIVEAQRAQAAPLISGRSVTTLFGKPPTLPRCCRYGNDSLRLAPQGD